MKASEAKTVLEKSLKYAEHNAEQYFEENKGTILEVITRTITNCCTRGVSSASTQELAWSGLYIPGKTQTWYNAQQDMFYSLMKSLGYTKDKDSKWSWGDV